MIAHQTKYNSWMLPYTKETDTEPQTKWTSKHYSKKCQYLHYSSAHPKQTFKSVVKGQSIRLLRACSSET